MMFILLATRQPPSKYSAAQLDDPVSLLFPPVLTQWHETSLCLFDVYT